MIKETDCKETAGKCVKNSGGAAAAWRTMQQ